MKTVTVKQQKELDQLMRTLKQKTGKFIANTLQIYYHDDEPKCEYNYYMEGTDHEYFNTIEELIEFVGMKVRKEEYAHRD
jgi:hypothetical protein